MPNPVNHPIAMINPQHIPNTPTVESITINHSSNNMNITKSLNINNTSNVLTQDIEKQNSKNAIVENNNLIPNQIVPNINAKSYNQSYNSQTRRIIQ